MYPKPHPIHIHKKQVTFHCLRISSGHLERFTPPYDCALNFLLAHIIPVIFYLFFSSFSNMKNILYLFGRKTICLRTDLLEISVFLLMNLREFPLNKEFCEEKGTEMCSFLHISIEVV